jgi:hypothetical protein
MDSARLMIVAVVAIGFFYVVVPVAFDVYLRFRRPRTVRCPETGLGTEIEVDAWHAAATAVPGPPSLVVADCSRWPAHAGCHQECLAAAPSR